MAQVLTVTREPWQYPRPEKLSLLHMPYEIRAMIYELVLVEPRLLERTHKLSCVHKPRLKDDVEVVPFFLTLGREPVRPGGPHARSSPEEGVCRCGWRTGMELLRTCRKVHLEASRIFFSRNTFQFFNIHEFMKTIGETLLPQQRSQVRSLSLLDQTGEWTSSIWKRRLTHSSILNRDFWSVVRQCDGLTRLEIPAFALIGVAELLDGGELVPPGLKFSSVKVTHLISFYKSNQVRWPPLDLYHLCGSYPKPLVVRCSRTVLLRDVWDREANRETRRDLERNMRVHVKTLVKTQFLGVAPLQLEDWENTMRLDPSLRQGDSVRHVVLPTGERIKIEFFGLPISEATRAQMAKDEMKLDSAQKEINGLSPAQQKGKLVDRRLRRRLQLKNEQRASARQRRKNILRAIEKAGKIRYKERKRVKSRKRVTPRTGAGLVAP